MNKYKKALYDHAVSTIYLAILNRELGDTVKADNYNSQATVLTMVIAQAEGISFSEAQQTIHIFEPDIVSHAINKANEILAFRGEKNV